MTRTSLSRDIWSSLNLQNQWRSHGLIIDNFPNSLQCPRNNGSKLRSATRSFSVIFQSSLDFKPLYVHASWRKFVNWLLVKENKQLPGHHEVVGIQYFDKCNSTSTVVRIPRAQLSIVPPAWLRHWKAFVSYSILSDWLIKMKCRAAERGGPLWSSGEKSPPFGPQVKRVPSLVLRWKGSPLWSSGEKSPPFGPQVKRVPPLVLWGNIWCVIGADRKTNAVKSIINTLFTMMYNLLGFRVLFEKHFPGWCMIKLKN